MFKHLWNCKSCHTARLCLNFSDIVDKQLNIYYMTVKNQNSLNMQKHCIASKNLCCCQQGPASWGQTPLLRRAVSECLKEMQGGVCSAASRVRVRDPHRTSFKELLQPLCSNLDQINFVYGVTTLKSDLIKNF